MQGAFTVALAHIDEIGCPVNLGINIVILALNYYEKVVDQYAQLVQFGLHIESSVPKQAFLSPSGTHSGAGVRWIIGIIRSSTHVHL